MGLHPKTDERMIYKFFATNCGKICDVQIVKDPHSGRSKGNGYVEFYEASSVLKAINFSGTPINGQPIRVQPVNMPRNLDVPETPLERQVRASDKLYMYFVTSFIYIGPVLCCIHAALCKQILIFSIFRDQSPLSGETKCEHFLKTFYEISNH